MKENCGECYRRWYCYIDPRECNKLTDSISVTNADHIRSMNDEELAMFLCDFRSCDADEYICEGCKAAKYCRAGHAGIIDWLQQPAEENDYETN